MKLDKLITQTKNAKLVVLIDPDKFNPDLIKLCDKSKVSFFLVGGSELKKNNLSQVISSIKKISKKPVIIFPGNETQISKNADGMLLLNLISGRNPDYLIGKHVKAAKTIVRSKIETWPTGYILIHGSKISTTQRVTKTEALKNLDEIVSTAIAGELLGLKAIYLEAGSGAKKEVNTKIIKAVKKQISLPLFVGGGINSYTKAKKAIEAGANFVVVGNALEKNIYLLTEIEKAFK
ncbi:MAG: geranylgeranylglyceryl/heptaprenylglyceryl phosphate synthase [Bacteroidia bacterium]|nr:geranylgeranylglyceryl/heptaprenylglyceryl phosphate synthase [Bacteroidia bacterium]